MVGARRGGDRGVVEARTAFAAGRVGPVVLLAGPERLHAEELVDLLIERLVPAELQVFNVNRYRGGQDSAETIFTTAGTLPMFCERRVVVVWDADDMGRSDLESLTRYAAQASPSTALVLVAGETGEKLPAALKKISERFVLWRPFRADAVTWAMQRAKSLGKDLPRPVAESLFDLCADESGDGRASLSDLAIELEKVTLAAGDRPTVRADDLEVVGRHAEARVLYQIESAVAERDLATALRSLDAALLFPRENGPIRIVAMLGERFRKMLAARDRIEAGYSTQAVLEGMWFPGPGGSAPFLKSVGQFRRTELVQALEELARLDRALKTGQAEPDRTHLELAIRRICGVRRTAPDRTAPAR